MVVHTNVAGWKTKKIKKGTYTLSISKTGETSDNNINLLVRQGKDTTESNTITQIAQFYYTIIIQSLFYQLLQLHLCIHNKEGLMKIFLKYYH